MTKTGAAQWLVRRRISSQNYLANQTSWREAGSATGWVVPPDGETRAFLYYQHALQFAEAETRRTGDQHLLYCLSESYVPTNAPVQWVDEEEDDE